ncbi:trigger factor [Mycoplasma buteonis]|uniref:trigger factor n=1 Tax=Mycoplasma buteonis TaxID=171280 RepID=UPI00056C0309|nr:trigger factor [Mycoplasma buteonis]
MKHELNEAKNELVVLVDASKEEMETTVQKYVDSALKTVKVPGYRPGKAPKEKALARVNFEEVNNKALNDLFNQKYFSVLTYISENKLEASSQFFPSLDTKEDGSFTLKYHFALLPKFNFEIANAKSKMGELKATDAELEAKLEQWLKSLSVPTQVEGPTQNGDVVNIDFKGFINNEPFEGGEAAGYDLTLGSNSFIPGFESQLEGKEKGWKGSINVTFPADYFSKEYQGKEAVFEVTINSIKRAESMELKDELVEQFFIDNVKTVADFKAFFFKKQATDHFFKIETDYLNSVIAEVAATVSAPLHESFFSEEVDKLEKELANQLKTFKIKKSEYLGLVKLTEEELHSQFVKQAEKEVLDRLATGFLFEKYKDLNSEELVEKIKALNLFPANSNEETSQILAKQFLMVQALLEETKSEKAEQHKAEFDALTATK